MTTTSNSDEADMSDSEVAPSASESFSMMDDALEAKLSGVVDLLLGAKHVGIISHERPDADAIGSSIALSMILDQRDVENVVFNVDGLPESLKFLPGSRRCRKNADLLSRCDLIVLLDCGFSSRAGATPKSIWQKPVVVIDHHESVDKKLAKLCLHDPHASSTAELIFLIGAKLDIAWDADIAANIFAGIHTDTGGFRYSKTSARTFLVAAALAETEFDIADVANSIYEQQPLRIFRLKSEVLSRIEFAASGSVAFIAITDEQKRRHGVHDDDLLALVNEARSIAGVEVAMQLEERGDGTVKVSLRSKSYLDVARVAEQFGGGGHTNAAGCRISGSLSNVLARLKNAIEPLVS